MDLTKQQQDYARENDMKQKKNKYDFIYTVGIYLNYGMYQRLLRYTDRVLPDFLCVK